MKHLKLNLPLGNHTHNQFVRYFEMLSNNYIIIFNLRQDYANLTQQNCYSDKTAIT